MADAIESGEEVTSPVTPANEVTTTGSEAVTNTVTPSEQSIPFERFQEVNDKLKEERAAREQLAQQVESLNSRFAPPVQEEEIDPEVEKVLNQFVKKNGFVSKAELEQVQREAELKIQAQNDIADLKKEFSDFDQTKVLAYAKENGVPITNKASLRAIYRDMNFDSITDAAKKAAVAEFQQSGRTTGNTASSTTQTQTPQSAPTARSRIAAAKLKLGI